MKPSLVTYIPLTCAIVSGAPAFNIWDESNRQLFRINPGAILQQPLRQPNIVMPPTTGSGSTAPEGIIISDVIGKVKDAAIFSQLTSGVNSVSDRLDNSAQNATVLAPSNEAMKSLPRRPWEDPQDYDELGANAYAGAQGENRAQQNMRRFVEAHIIPVSPWEENQKVKTLAGNEIWYEVKDGKKTIHPGNVEVVSVADSVSNGEIWIVNGVVNYAS